VEYLKKNIIRGAIIYPAGDTIAALLLHEFCWSRFFGMAFIGATVYAFEIPNFFTWIERKTKNLNGIKQTFAKTLLAIGYFNPLWIARHLFFIKLFSFQLNQVGWDILLISSQSFLVNIPISFLANYLIQNVIKLEWRFLASAVFSALMAIYYAMSYVLFA
jgi:hypothetical protein